MGTEFWIWHYVVLLYDDKSYELYEMSRPMDRNGICMILDIWEIKNLNMSRYNDNEIPMDELMLPVNEDIRTAIKIKQENFYITD